MPLATPEEHIGRVRGELKFAYDYKNETFIWVPVGDSWFEGPTDALDLTRVIHLIQGQGCRCTPKEYLNATHILGNVTCKNCLRHVRRSLERNLETFQRYVDLDLLPPVYADMGATREDIRVGLEARKKRLAQFDRMLETR